MGWSGDRQALGALHPRYAVIVPAAIVLSFVLLLIGLSLPLLYTQKVFWKSTYSVWDGVVSLWEQGEHELALVIFFFSIAFPIFKLAALLVIWFVPLAERHRASLLHWLGLLGKWSMLDVFIVAILIVLVKLGPLVKVEPRIGVYVFAAAIACSMLSAMLVDRLARRSFPSQTPLPPAVC